MNLEDMRITPEDIAGRGVVAAPDILQGTPAENKAVFDRLIREHVALAVNGMLDALAAMRVCEAFNPSSGYVPYNQAVWNGSTYINKEACRGIYPDDTRYWLLTASKGADGQGTGDMRADVYDRENRKLDIYNYAMAKAPEDAGQLLAAADDGSAVGCGLTPQEITARLFKVYDTPGTYTFIAPGTGDYIVEVVGGGGSNRTSGEVRWNGAGAGYAKKCIFLTKGQQITITVGAGGSPSGGASSFGSEVTATGSSYTTPGSGIGGDLNIVGGSPPTDYMSVGGGSFLSSPSPNPEYGGYGVGGWATNSGTSGVVIISR